MDPRLMQLLQLLAMLQMQGGGQQQRGRPQGTGMGAQQGRASYATNPMDPTSANPYSPGAAQLLGQIWQDFMNKGGGFVGNDIVGGGQVFGGMYRGPQGSFSPYQTGPNVGNVSFLRGDSPGMGASPMASLYNFFGPGRTGGGMSTDPTRAGQSEFFNNPGGAGQLEGQGTNYYL
jgi:hypothetical protein